MLVLTSNVAQSTHVIANYTLVKKFKGQNSYSDMNDIIFSFASCVHLLFNIRLFWFLVLYTVYSSGLAALYLDHSK